LNKYEIGARIHDIFQTRTDNFAGALKSTAVKTVQLTMPKFFYGFDFERNDFSASVANRIKEQFAEADVRIAVLSCYINPLNTRDFGRDRELFKKFTDYAAALGVEIIGTETGTAVEDYESDCSPNHSAEMFDMAVENMSGLCAYAAKKGVLTGIECVSYFPVHSAATLAKFMRAVGGQSTAVIFDPVNLFTAADCHDQREIMRGFVSEHARAIRAAHLKDFTVKDGRLLYKPPFAGEFDADYFLRLLREFDVSCDIILENSDSESLGGAMKRLRQRINSIAEERGTVPGHGQAERLLEGTT
jgi:sugar phosphate isomerase/epimerase